MSPQHLSRVLLLAALTTLLLGCPQGEKSAAQGASASGEAIAGAIKIKGGDGKVVYRIKPREGGFKASNEAKTELYRFKVDGSKVKVKDPKDVNVAYVNTDGTKFKVKDAADKTVLFKLHPQADGDYKLETGTDELVCKIKKRDYGWEIKDAAGTELVKIKNKEGKTSIKDAKTDASRYYTKDKVSSLAFACLGLPKLSEEQKLGLLILVNQSAK